MTTNQTIDGVPRDYVLRLTPEAHSVLMGMVEHCLNVRACMGMDEGYKNFADEQDEHDFVKELRALLDAKPETVAGHHPACRAVDDYKPGECTHSCNPASKIQGEPVARIDGMYGDPEAFAEREIRALCDVNKLKIGTLLYAEQPAPVAVAMPERRTSDHYHTRMGKCAAAELLADEWNACLDEVTRLNAKSR